MRSVNVFLVGLAVVAVASPSPAADPPKGRLAELVKLYQSYELPLPPKDAKLYRYPPPGAKSSLPRLGFGLNPEKDGIPTLFLAGYESSTFQAEYTAEVRPEAKEVAHYVIDITTIIQLHLQDRTALAEELLPKWQKESKQTPDQALALAAWHFWFDRLQDPKVDRALIVRRMASAMRAEPGAFSDSYHEMLFVDLRWSLMPSRAKPNTVEALIDEWLDIAEFFVEMPNDERYAAVVRQGFDAVPALIDALTDTRLTRSKESVWLTTEGIPVRIKSLAANILSQYMEDWKAADDEEAALDTKAAKKWWAKASRANEEEYMVSRVLKAKKNEHGPNDHLVVVVRHKYPKRLPALFREVLTDHPDMSLDSLAAAVATSSLPTNTKRELLLEAIGSKNVYRQRAGRDSLYEVDPERCNRIVIDSLAKLPATPSVPYHLYYQGSFAPDVLRTTDAKVWEAAEQYVRRADAGVRVEWLKDFLYVKQPAETRRRCVEFAAKFLTDATVRDPTAEPKMYPHGYAGYTQFEKIEVRNYAAFALSYLLELKTKPSPKWSADEWAKFRDEMAKAAKAGK